MGKNTAPTCVEDKPKATMSIDIPKEMMKMFAPYKGYTVGDSADITVSGKVTGVRMDQYGCRLDMELGQGKPKNMKEADDMAWEEMKEGKKKDKDE